MPVADQYAVQEAVPARKQTRKQTKNNKANQKGKTHTNHNTNQTKTTERIGIATSNGNYVHDDILCVILRMAQNKKQNRNKHKTHQWAISVGERSNKAPCGNQGIPPARIPEITKSSRSGMTLHPGTSKQTPTTPGRNESGEKRKNGETGR